MWCRYFMINFILNFVVLITFTLNDIKKACLCEKPNAVQHLWLSSKNNTKFSIFHNVTAKKTEAAKRQVDTSFHGRPKTRQEKWHVKFNTTQDDMQEKPPLVVLLLKIVQKYSKNCTPIVMYDEVYERENLDIITKLLQDFPTTYIFGKIQLNQTKHQTMLEKITLTSCRSYILFLSDIFQTQTIIGTQLQNRVTIVPLASQWAIEEFLSSHHSRELINLLLIVKSYSSDPSKANSYVLYTHNLYTDGLGSSKPILLTTWIKGRQSRPHVNLFPRKITKGFAGHRLSVVLAHQPPFVFKKIYADAFGNVRVEWDGLEYRILKLLAQTLNFTVNLVEPAANHVGASESVVNVVRNRMADIGIAGIYATKKRCVDLDMSVPHTSECARFITLASKSLPRYRAILGPFQLPVWIAITVVYLLAILLLAFSDRLSLSHLIGNFTELENMFWYVFGTFTNSLTFTGQYSWSSSKKTSTRMLIGWYWVFSIIITACYTGSIIAFVTMPIYPETIDTTQQLLKGYYRIGTLDHGGWERWFANSTDPQTVKVQDQLEFVSSLEEGIQNITEAFIWPYAFIGSENELKYLIQSNFSDESSETTLHISDECFARFDVSFVFPRNSIYRILIDDAILRFQKSGLINQLARDLSFDTQRSPTGSRLQAASGQLLHMETIEQRGLSLTDTEGMFVLLGAGFVIAASTLFSEWIGGCRNKCKMLINTHSSACGESMQHLNSAASIQTGNSNKFYNHHQRSSSICLSSFFNKKSAISSCGNVRRRNSTIIISKYQDLISNDNNIKSFSFRLPQHQKEQQDEPKIERDNIVSKLFNYLDNGIMVEASDVDNGENEENGENNVKENKNLCKFYENADESFGAKIFH